MRALVLFRDEGVHIFRPLLKPGFRHVFCALQDERGYWIKMDARAGVPEIRVIAGPDYDLISFYEECGYTVVETETGEDSPRGPFAFANCVGYVKAALAIRSAALTPWQLYQHLIGEPYVRFSFSRQV